MTLDPCQAFADGKPGLNAAIQGQNNAVLLLRLARLVCSRGLELRLIEMMDVGSRNGSRHEVWVPAAEMKNTLHYPSAQIAVAQPIRHSQPLALSR